MLLTSLRERRPDPLGELLGDIGVGVRQHDRELLVAHAREQVGDRAFALEDLRKGTQGLIARGLSEVVVDLLAVIGFEADHAQREPRGRYPSLGMYGASSRRAIESLWTSSGPSARRSVRRWA